MAEVFDHFSLGTSPEVNVCISLTECGSRSRSLFATAMFFCPVSLRPKGMEEYDTFLKGL